jgi:hypothetical protein
MLLLPLLPELQLEKNRPMKAKAEAQSKLARACGAGTRSRINEIPFRYRKASPGQETLNGTAL